jgi:hypothetical protein
MSTRSNLRALPRAAAFGVREPLPVPALFLSVDESCRLLGVSRPWAYIHLFGPLGEVIPTVSLEGGRRRLVPYAALVAYANEQMAAAGIDIELEAAEPPRVASGRRAR